MRQTQLNFAKDVSKAPYNGLFYCHIRGGLFRWPEYITFLKNRNL